MLAQGRDLAPRVPAVLLPMSAGAVWDGVWIFAKLLTFRRMQKAFLGGEDTVRDLAQPISWPGSREIKHDVAGIQQNALQDRSPSSGCHSDRRFTVPPF